MTPAKTGTIRRKTCTLVTTFFISSSVQMRAPPNPRKSRLRVIRRALHNAHNVLTIRKMRRKWNLHHLHKIHRRNILSSKDEKITHSMNTPLILEDVMERNSSNHSPAGKNKPLLIASFPHGCARSPRVRLLQRNTLSRFFVSRRRYKLRKFNPGKLKTGNEREIRGRKGHLHKAHIIRKQAAKHADVRINFEKRNVMKTVLLPLNIAENKEPSYLQFDTDQSIKLADYPSLSTRICQPGLANAQSETENLSLAVQCKKKVRNKLEALRWVISESIPRFTMADHPEIIAVSSAHISENQATDRLDIEPQRLQEKISSIVEISRLAGSTVSNYTQMMHKLNSISPQASNNVRALTVRRLVK